MKNDDINMHNNHLSLQDGHQSKTSIFSMRILRALLPWHTKVNTYHFLCLRYQYFKGPKNDTEVKYKLHNVIKSRRYHSTCLTPNRGDLFSVHPWPDTGNTMRCILHSTTLITVSHRYCSNITGRKGSCRKIYCKNNTYYFTFNLYTYWAWVSQLSI